MRELALHLLDIAENSVAAGATQIRITVKESPSSDRLILSVEDNGRGMDAQTIAKVIDPFYTSRTTRKVGLGIPLLKEAAEACNGSLEIRSEPGKGTFLIVEFQRSHIDRMPLGDLPSTWMALLVSAPQIHWIFEYRSDDREFVFDDSEVKGALDGVPLSEPEVLTWLRGTLEDGVAETQPEDVFSIRY